MIISFPDFTTKLAQGQLKNTSLVNDAYNGEINPTDQEQILGLLNQGLVDITTKKKLWTNTTALTFVTDQNIYQLTATPDYDGFVRLLSVHAVPTGYEVVEENERTFTPKGANGITQPSPTSIRFSNRFMENYGPAVDLHWQMQHPTVGLLDNIDIPANLHEALVLYVSGLYLSHMGGEEHTNKGDSYYGLYLKMMSDDTMENTSGTSEVVDEDTRFSDRGFV